MVFSIVNSMMNTLLGHYIAWERELDTIREVFIAN